MLENLDITKELDDLYSFSFESESVLFGGLVRFDSSDERGQTVVEWDDTTPDNWEEIEEKIISNCF